MRTLDEQVADFKADFEPFQKYKELFEQWKEGSETHWELRPWNDRPNFNGLRWTWDEEWDGLLVRRCYCLEAQGFVVTQFYRKMKIKLRKPKGMTRMEVLEKVILAVGDDWTGISFKGGVYVWWGNTSPNARW